MKEYKLAELFNSFQGEYPHIGRYSTFIRFWKCNLHCIFDDNIQCDTMYDKHVIKHEIFTYNQIKQHVLQTNFITFTGGEPLLFTDDIISIAQQLLVDNIFIDKILIESNGTLMQKYNDIAEHLITYFKQKIYKRVNLVWSPKFIDSKTIDTMFSNLYEYFNPASMYIKIVSNPKWEDIIISFLDKCIELYGLRIKSKICLMFLTNENKQLTTDSIELSLELAQRYSVNITSRLHMELNIP